jgi:hypothetical protein
MGGKGGFFGEALQELELETKRTVEYIVDPKPEALSALSRGRTVPPFMSLLVFLIIRHQMRPKCRHDCSTGYALVLIEHHNASHTLK